MGSDSSVLNDVKSFLLIPEEVKDFDQTLALHINAQLVFLNELGFGEDLPDEISGEDTTWADVVGDLYNSDLKLLVALRTKLVFDTPAVGSVTAALERQISEAEWRVHARREVKT